MSLRTGTSFYLFPPNFWDLNNIYPGLSMFWRGVFMTSWARHGILAPICVWRRPGSSPNWGLRPWIICLKSHHNGSGVTGRPASPWLFQNRNKFLRETLTEYFLDTTLLLAFIRSQQRGSRWDQASGRRCPGPAFLARVCLVSQRGLSWFQPQTVNNVFQEPHHCITPHQWTNLCSPAIRRKLKILLL